jgi:energy-coupling factor transporter ATP-binding protein EcfA2
MENIYIPLGLVPFGADDEEQDTRVNPTLLGRTGGRFVVLGDPGSGKSTLLRFLALVGHSTTLQARTGGLPDTRLPILVSLRRYADELKRDANLSLLDYIVLSTRADYSLVAADDRFFRYFLEAGRAIALFDGLDELPNPSFRETVRDRIRAMSVAYPDNTVCVTSRIVGYEDPMKFDSSEFSHFKVGRLTTSDIRHFVQDWYSARVEDPRERQANTDDLVRIVESPGNRAIRELAQNPLLLTIVALVHRIDAVLPDERVVLYAKCTETLLNTWNTWRLRELEVRGRGRIERRNRQRVEAIAWWMHELGGSATSGRSVVSLADLTTFLANYIESREGASTEEAEAEAEDFARFVRVKAGLMVEVGPDAYGFLHQTFQEYLAASYLVSSSELTGASALWLAIREHLADARWQEVIRLAIAALRSDDAQELIVANILAEDPGQGDHCQLLAGLVLDNVEGARKHDAVIVDRLLEGAAYSRSDEDVQATVSLLKALRGRDPGTARKIRGALQSRRRAGIDKRSRFALVAIALGETAASRRLDSGRAVGLVEAAARPTVDGDLGVEVDTLDNFIPAMVLESPAGNLMGAMLCCLRSRPIRGEVLGGLAAALAGRYYGPFSHFAGNLLLLRTCDDKIWRSVARQRLDGTHDKSVTVDLEGQDPARSVYSLMLEGMHARLVRILKGSEYSLTSFRRGDRFDVDLVIRRDVLANSGRHSREGMWKRCWAVPAIEGVVSHLLVEGPRLTPAPQWHEAFKGHLSRAIAAGVVAKTQSSLAFNPTEAAVREDWDEWSLARLLLQDAWLAAFELVDPSGRIPQSIVDELKSDPSRPIASFTALVHDSVLGDSACGEEVKRRVASPDDKLGPVLATIGLTPQRAALNPLVAQAASLSH